MFKSNGFWTCISVATLVAALTFTAFSINRHNQQVAAECSRYPLGCEVAREK